MVLRFSISLLILLHPCVIFHRAAVAKRMHPFPHP